MLETEPFGRALADGKAEAAPFLAARVLAEVRLGPSVDFFAANGSSLTVGLPPQIWGIRMLKIVLLLFLHYLNLMVETIGEAFSLGWRLKARCAYGKREGLKSIRDCTWTYDLDMLTLVTRGRDFPLAILASRLRCPRCGSRLVSVVFIPPADGDLRRGAA